MDIKTLGEGDPVVVVCGDGLAGLELLCDWFQLVAVPRADRLAEFVAELGLGPVRLLGRAEGAAAALRLALERPDLVSQVAVLGPLPACEGLPGRGWLAALATMATPLLVLQGDDDALDIAHSAALTRAVPDGRLAVLPGPSRLLPVAKPELFGLMLLDFYEEKPSVNSPTFVPRTA